MPLRPWRRPDPPAGAARPHVRGDGVELRERVLERVVHDDEVVGLEPPGDLIPGGGEPGADHRVRVGRAPAQAPLELALVEGARARPPPRPARRRESAPRPARRCRRARCGPRRAPRRPCDGGCHIAYREPRPTPRTRPPRRARRSAPARRSGSRCRPLLAARRRVVAEIENTASGGVARNRCASVVLPAPDGAERTRSSPGPARSLDILHLLAHALDLGLEGDDHAGDLGALRLRAGRVHLAVHLLDEEVELASGGLARGEQRRACATWLPEPISSSVTSVRSASSATSWARRAGSSAMPRASSATRSSSRARWWSTACGESAATRAASASTVEPAGQIASERRPSRRASPRARRAPPTARPGPPRAPPRGRRRARRAGSTPSAARTSASVAPVQAEARLQLGERARVGLGERDVDPRGATRPAPATRRTETSTPPAGEPLLHRLRGVHLERGELARQADLHLAELVVDGAGSRRRAPRPRPPPRPAPNPVMLRIIAPPAELHGSGTVARGERRGALAGAPGGDRGPRRAASPGCRPRCGRRAGRDGSGSPHPPRGTRARPCTSGRRDLLQLRGERQAGPGLGRHGGVLAFSSLSMSSEVEWSLGSPVTATRPP